MKNIQEPAFSLTTAYTSLVGVSDMRMNRNRNRKSDSLVSGCRKVKPKIVLVYIKNINIIAQQTNKQTKQKKIVSRSFTNQSVPYMI